MYLALVVDSTTSNCFFKLQDTAPLSIVKTYLDIEWQWCCEAPSASENPSNLILSRLSSTAHAQLPPLPMTSHRSIIPFKYLYTHLTSFKCGHPGFCMNCDRNMIAHVVFPMQHTLASQLLLGKAHSSWNFIGKVCQGIKKGLNHGVDQMEWIGGAHLIIQTI